MKNTSENKMDWILPLIAATLAISGIILSAYLTFHYRSLVKKKQRKIENFTAANLEISNKLEKTTGRIEDVMIDVKKITLSIDTITQGTHEIGRNNQKLAQNNLKLTEQLNELSTTILGISNKLKYPVDDNFSCNIEFFLSIHSIEKYFNPDDYGMEIELFKDTKGNNKRSLKIDILQQVLKELFILIRFKDDNGSLIINNDIESSFLIESNLQINKLRNFRKTKIIAVWEEGDKLRVRINDLGLRLNINTGIESLLDLEKSRISISLLKIGNTPVGFLDASIDIVRINSNNRMIFDCKEFAREKENGIPINIPKSIKFLIAKKDL